MTRRIENKSVLFQFFGVFVSETLERSTWEAPNTFIFEPYDFDFLSFFLGT